ncbi:DUF6884 domain-containing protein [Bacillus marinisedimentorum]|uniref:DUF6884 domain-containing protein n=1 Tax=Bacillus marinisedimentorum TaxID=1821260 RepID=UPI000871B58D|nr:DUF6884 domain-containing protein [Bacillus marinisedimentorum]
MKRVGLLATARKKQNRPAPVHSFYTSTLFQKSIAYAAQYYDTLYFYNAKDGLLFPDTIMQPYDVSIRSLSSGQKLEWADRIVKQLSRHEPAGECSVFLHGGKVYRDYLEPALQKAGFSFEVPLQGLGIGRQLSWYSDRLERRSL